VNQGGTADMFYSSLAEASFCQGRFLFSGRRNYAITDKTMAALITTIQTIKQPIICQEVSL